MVYYAKGSEKDVLGEEDLKKSLFEALGKLGVRNKVLVIPPDYTRFHSHAGILTRFAWQYYGDKLKDVLPALGTHSAMTEPSIRAMFGGTPSTLFRVHNWRTDIVTVGEVSSDFIQRESEGKLQYSWQAQVNRLIAQGGHDLVLSIGQVVPHEVIGIAGYNKNVLIGCGGPESINKSHFLGAVYGMERIMGRADNPVRRVLNFASDNFLKQIPIIYVLTVVAQGADGKLKVRGLFVGDDREAFTQAAKLAMKVNFQMLDKPLSKVVVYLDPAEYKSTWLGNKSIYRTRMAIADGGELVVLAPGLKEFGEDRQIDSLIRKYGYVNTPRVLKHVNDSDDLKHNLSAAAHLIHGTSEGRFRITYCPGHLSQREIESVNFGYADLKQMVRRYNPQTLKEGFNKMMDGEEVFYISNPALGLWAHRKRFEDD
ncbi:MAG TPA: lactate racemase domain-containing protein [Bacteroidota bacterium]|nr:lactate racemase domain-containing protein [Bacteroidota bacterium]